MKAFLIPCIVCGMLFVMPACTTKVYNQEPVGRTTIIEKDRPVVTERQVDRTPDVQNNIRIDK